MPQRLQVKILRVVLALVLFLLVLVLAVNGSIQSKVDDKLDTEIKSREVIIVELEQEKHNLIEELKSKEQRKKEAAEAKKAKEVTEVALIDSQTPPRANCNPTSDLKKLARDTMLDFFPQSQWPYMHDLICRESGYVNQYNQAGSGACGYAQFLPCNKYGLGPMINQPAEVQFTYMNTYIRDKFGNPSRALAFHNRANSY